MCLLFKSGIGLDSGILAHPLLEVNVSISVLRKNVESVKEGEAILVSIQFEQHRFFQLKRTQGSSGVTKVGNTLTVFLNIYHIEFHIFD